MLCCCLLLQQVTLQLEPVMFQQDNTTVMQLPTKKGKLLGPCWWLLVAAT
jgi:hypothetical protein